MTEICSSSSWSYVDGASLSELIGRGRPPWRLALGLMRQVAEGIGHAHAAGVIHCDIKADNVRVTPRHLAKVIDFGLSRAKNLPIESAARFGTVPYMPPERLIDGDLSVAGDIYSLGVTLFELLTGRRPFAGDDELSLVANILEGQPAQPSTLVPGLPSSIDDVLARALDKDPVRRHQTAREFIADLDAILQKSQTWGELAMRVAVGIALGLVALTVIGYIASAALDAGLGRTGAFRQETAWSWPLWGWRAMGAPVLMTLLALLAVSLVRFVGEIALSLWRHPAKLKRSPLPIGWWRRFNEQPVAVLAKGLIVAQSVAMAAFVVRFSDVLAGLFNFGSPAASGDLASLLRTTSNAPDQYRIVMSLLLLLFAASWARIAGTRAAWRNRDALVPVIGGLAATAASVFLLAAPYRVIYRNDGERVCHGTDVCYLVGQRGDESLLFCPRSAERRRIIPSEDARLMRTGVVENVFSLYAQAPEERCTTRGPVAQRPVVTLKIPE